MLQSKVYKIIGLMSGTSLDGLDMAYTRLWKENETWSFELKAARSIAYDIALKDQLKSSVDMSSLNLFSFDVELGRRFGAWVRDFIQEERLEVDYIASHGHTVFHHPDKGFTTQIGNAQLIKEITSLPVIADFRYLDVVRGGQGAPLVPIGDHHLFTNMDFCLNLGGISNISFDHNASRIAFDIGPANMLLNNIIKTIGLEYDDEGKLARSGKLIGSFKSALDALDYYKLGIPKSLGYEWFQDKVEPILAQATSDYAIADVLHTSVHHIAEQVRKHIDRFSHDPSGRLMVSGGGAFNLFMMDVLRDKLAPIIELYIPTPEIIEYKEAIVFALMGAMRLEGDDNILSSVTGADQNSCAGVIFN